MARAPTIGPCLAARGSRCSSSSPNQGQRAREGWFRPCTSACARAERDVQASHPSWNKPRRGDAVGPPSTVPPALGDPPVDAAYPLQDAHGPRPPLHATHRLGRQGLRTRPTPRTAFADRHGRATSQRLLPDGNASYRTNRRQTKRAARGYRDPRFPAPKAAHPESVA